MKKRLLAMAIAVCMGFTFTACKKEDETSGAEGKYDGMTTYEILSELEIDDYVVLGEYKGLELEKAISAVTEEDIEAEIEFALTQYPAEVKDRTEVQKDDIVNIDYVGRLDGEAFEGGSDENFNLKIGSGQFIEGFEDGLIGKTVGTECVLKLSFPEDYGVESLNGQEVEFTVTINKICLPLDEPTDEWVAENVEGHSTVAEYREAVRELLEQAYEQKAEEQLVYTAWTAVIENCNVLDYPQVLVERGADIYKADIESYATYCSMSLEDYVEYCGATMEEFEQYALEYGESIASQALINYAICQKEGYELGDEGYQEELSLLLLEYDCTEEELFASYNRDDIEQTILLNRVCDMIIDEADVTEVEAKEE